MSKWIHCDNADCAEQKPDDGIVRRRMCEPDWVVVEEDERVLHFHSPLCLAEHLSPLLAKADA